ncbi:MAG: pseudouridine synthase [Alphaproteobacteria bacterium]|jgi:23S rRNA pseudouridine955/2504/2580 synthase|nr:RluA family pseudouridine synthase [Candidatus Jidaibacter sp.]
MDFKKVTVLVDDSDIRLDRWFKRHHQHVAFTQIVKMARKKLIKINGKRCEASTRVMEGDVISFPEFETFSEVGKQEHKDKISKQNRELITNAVMYKDDDIIVLNKPSGLAVQGGTKIATSVDDLAECIKFEYDDKPKLVHRIDKETSGLLIMARKTVVAAQLAQLFRTRHITKKYLALIRGVPKDLEGKIVSKISKVKIGKFERMVENEEGKTAITHYKVIDSAAKEYALLELDIITGKTHQIRAQLAEMGTPIVGDDKYGSRTQSIGILDKKLYLHAYKMDFGLNKKKYELEADLPSYFEDALNTLALSVK